MYACDFTEKGYTCIPPCQRKHLTPNLTFIRTQSIEEEWGRETERERDRGRKGGRQRGHRDRAMVGDTGVQPAVRGSGWRWSRPTGQALCAGAPSLPCSLSSPIHSHTAPPAPPAIHQSGHRGAAAQQGHIKAFSRWEAQGWCWHNTEEHRRKQGRPVWKKRSPNGPFLAEGQHQNKTFHSLHKPALCQPCIQRPRHIFSHCLEPMAPLSVWTRGII